jgi:protein SCO1/2
MFHAFLRRTALPGLLALSLSALVGCPQEGPKDFPHAILTPEPSALPSVTLVKADGKPFSTDTLKGGWTWVYFGFANCPDVCPEAMSFMSDEYKRLKHPDKVTPLFVSVDPKRDTPEKLRQYAKYYNPKIQAATGEKAEIDRFAKALGAAYVIDPPRPNGASEKHNAAGKEYNVSHTNLVFVLDPQGRMVAVYVPGVKAGDMAEDFDRLTAS